jgi:L-fuculose-phosphate aldolase
MAMAMMGTQPRTQPWGGELSKAEVRLAANLALASRVLSAGGHDDLNQGQISARLPGSERFLIKGALTGFDEARPTDMVCASVDAEPLPDPAAPPELPLHQATYAARPDVNAIVHSHAPYSLVFGATSWELHPISHDGAYFAGRLPRFTATSNTVLDLETGESIAAALGDAPALLLRNHGGLIVGRSVREATVLALILERAARLQVMAESTGAAYSHASAEDVRRKREFVYSGTAIKAYWDYCVRRVKAQQRETLEW